MHIDDAAVRRIAELARIGLDGDDLATYIGDLESILDLVERMNAVDTQAIAPLAHPIDVTQRLRDDEVTEQDQRAALQAGAPAVEAGLFLVPRVIE